MCNLEKKSVKVKAASICGRACYVTGTVLTSPHTGVPVVTSLWAGPCHLPLCSEIRPLTLFHIEGDCPVQQHFQDFSENGVWPGLANESHGGREEGRRKVFLSCLLLVVSQF